MSLADYELVVGLEIHCQLDTQSKLFTSCPFDTGGEPNSRVDAFTLAWPGTLPVPNAKAVGHALRLALALGCDVQTRSRFARKHYFYPDLPHGYQITQADEPYARGGCIEFGEGERLELERIHMESDAGKTTHGVREGVSGVDYNRAGAPLVEIVSLPHLRSANAAAQALRSLRQMVRWLGVSEGDMEKGSLRCDANVSLRRKGTQRLGTRCEIKNLNSFRFLEQAIRAEARRQADLLDRGERVVQSTMAYDVERDRTWVMRSKEDAADYLYFPDPDLPPLHLAPERVEAARAELPELPAARHARYLAARESGADAPALSALNATVLSAEKALGDYFDEVVEAGAPLKLACNWVTGELLARLKLEGLDVGACPFRPQRMAALLQLLGDDSISANSAKLVFEEAFMSNAEPAQIVEAKGLAQVSDLEGLSELIAEVLTENPEQLAQYRGGKTKLRGFFVGQVMARTKGKANPKIVQSLLSKALDPNTER